MKLKRSIENGKVVFRNSETNEVVKTEDPVQISNSSESDIKDPRGNIIVTILYIFGFLFIILAIISFASSSIGGMSRILGAIIFGSASIPFFFFAQVLDNLIVQTFYLKNIYLNSEKQVKEGK